LVSIKLGFTAFGGPAAHIAMLHEEVVARRRWMTNQHFLDLLGATNLLPGPNSTEMVIHAGYEQSRFKGMLISGLCFILPASTITLAIAWLYSQYGSTPAGNWLLYGVKPVVIAVIASAIWTLARTAVQSPWLLVLGAAVTGLALAGISELALLFGAGLLAMAATNRALIGRRLVGSLALLPGGVASLTPTAALVAAAAPEPYSAWRLFLLFLRIGATLYGSGYVLIAFIQADLVDRLGWLTDEQLIDAVAVGQFTPGPVSSTATFVGYLVGGWWGAVLATVGIFLPAFIVVAIANPLLPKLRRSPWASGFLDGVNVAAIGLMAAVTWTLGQASIFNPVTVALTAGSLIAIVVLRINSAWLILGGAAIGVLVNWLPT
jgi:chromate transporter